jgi:2-oxoisovalerate dehydrogenase E1 component alpha subunit
MPRSRKSPSLSPEFLKRMYYFMALTRALDEREWILNRQGKAPFVISGQGHEAAQVGAAMALDTAVDIVCPYYRDMGVVLVFGMTPREIMSGLLARTTDPSSGGRQMPSHWGERARHIITGSSPVATQILHAAGTALASQMKGEAAVSAAFFGEGSSNQGEFHEGLNFASVRRLPVLFICENNGYAISVPQAKQFAVDSVATRAAGYGIPGIAVDGLDPVAVYEATRAAAERARRGEGPSLLEFKTVRLTSHSSDDDDRTYRSAEELKRERAEDPLPRFRRRLEDLGIWDEEQEAAQKKKIRAEVDDATRFAEAAPVPDPETLLLNVYA